MNIIEIIQKKKEGHPLTKEEIRFFVSGVTDETLPDYQVSALLMAICLKGMNDQETYELTMAMAESGDILDLSNLGRVILDKHSTGGVGDKTTLIVGPIMASLGVPVVKMSGRGLGATGGTIDKLDSIPGFSSEIDEDRFFELVKTVGFLDSAQSKNLAPADKRLYALRDVTATVDNISLIASSIMSKKLTSGANSIVLDVKCGSGAFMQDKESAKKLAETMIDIGKKAGRKCVALITDMNEPLGYAVGNRLEVHEVIQYLKGIRQEKNMKKVIDGLCCEMYKLSDNYNGEDNVEEIIENTVADGRAYAKFLEFVKAQGGDIDEFEKAFNKGSKYSESIKVSDIIGNSTSDPYIFKEINAGVMGNVSLLLGAGRMKKEDKIDPDAGIVFEKKTYDVAESNDIIATLYSNDETKLREAVKIFKNGIVLEKSENVVCADPILGIVQ